MTRRKYRNERIRQDGFLFDSKAEAARYNELCMLQQAGEIRGLAVHPTWVLQEGFTDRDGHKWRPITYTADFSYWLGNEFVVEDVKGVKTQVFRLKEKLFRFRYPEIQFVVVEV